jgi:opacity protein-like surface antigen
MDLRLFVVTSYLALAGACGFVSTSFAEVAAAPPAPRPWNGQTQESTSNAPMTEANGSRLRVSDKAVEDAEPKPRFASEAPLRKEAGYYLGVSAGMNFAQSDEIDTPGVGSSGSLAPVGGFKLGYVYPFDDEPIDQFKDETGGIGLRLAGALEVEAFYLRNESDFESPIGTREFTLDAGYFMLNAFLKARVSQFTFYGGPGVGLAWTHASGNALVGDQDDAYLAFQAVGGVEYLFNPDWSVFTEYKWLVTNDFSLKTVGNGNTDFGMYQQNLISFGVKRHF